MENKEKIICINCGKEVDEVCGDGYCRKCHVSLSFEDCVSGTWVARRNIEGFAKIGIDTKKTMKKLYPDADI